jgi:hypothetical protein
MDPKWLHAESQIVSRWGAGRAPGSAVAGTAMRAPEDYIAEAENPMSVQQTLDLLQLVFDACDLRKIRALDKSTAALVLSVMVSGGAARSFCAVGTKYAQGTGTEHALGGCALAGGGGTGRAAYGSAH